MAVETVRPLEEKTFQKLSKNTGLSEQFVALDPVWMSVIDFLPYQPPSPPSYQPPSYQPPSYQPVPLMLQPIGTGTVSVDLWLELMQLLDEDLHELLQMDHHKFWCQAVNDASLNRTIDSYLRLAPKPHDNTSESLSLDVQELMRSIDKRVFMVLLRLSTHKECSDDFLSTEAYSRIIYEHRIFDIPKLMDLCVLYGGSNRALVTKMVHNIFKRQPRYEEDWRQVVDMVLCTLSTMSDKVMGEGRAATRLDGFSKLSSSDFADVVLHLADFVGALHSFLSIYPRAACSLMAAGFMERAVGFYEATIPSLQENWHTLKAELPNQKHIKGRFRCLKSDLAWLVHEVLAVCFLSPQPPDSSGVRSKVSIDAFVSIMADMASERNFLREYKKQFDLVGDIQSVRSAHPEIPEDHFDYVLSALEDSSATKQEVDKKSGSQSQSSSVKDGGFAEAETVMESLVSQVKDLFPHLGEGFIKICLREFGNNPETVINKVLEDSLPPHLKNLDFTQPTGKLASSRPKSEVAAELMHDNPLIDQRKNVFDDDEFDVFRKPEKIDLSRVQIGKKLDSISIASMLDDKTHLEATRERYHTYQIETEGDYISEEQASKMTMDGEDGFASGVVGYDLMYEDEYDDTYDSQNVGAADDATDEQFIVKRLNKRGLVGMKLLEVSDEEEEDLLRYPNVSKKYADGRTHEQSIALKSAKDLICSISGLSQGGRQTKGDRPLGRGKFGKHGHEAPEWRSGPRDQQGLKNKGKEGWQRDDEDYIRTDKDNWRIGGHNYDSHARGTKKNEVVQSKQSGIVVLSREKATERSGVVGEKGDVSLHATDKQARPPAGITQRRGGEKDPQSASSRGEKNHLSASSQGYGEKNPWSASSQGHGEKNPRSSSSQGHGEKNPRSASSQGHGEKNPWSASSQGHGEKNPRSASSQGHGEKNPWSASSQGHGEKNPRSASSQGHGEKNPRSASSQGHGEKNPWSSSSQGHGEKNPQSASSQGYGEKNPWSASSQGHGEKNPQSASSQGYGEKNPQSASSQGKNPRSASSHGYGEKNPPSASSQGYGEKNPPSARHGEKNPRSASSQGYGENPRSASSQGHGEKNPQSATSQRCHERNSQSGTDQGRVEKNSQAGSVQGLGERGSKPDGTRQSESRARQMKDRNKGSRANHNRRDLADKKRRGGML